MEKLSVKKSSGNQKILGWIIMALGWILSLLTVKHNGNGDGDGNENGKIVICLD